MHFGKLIGYSAIIFDIPVCSFSRKISAGERQAVMDVMEAGDIVLTSDKLFPLWQLAVGIMGSPHYSHAAIYEGENRVIEATTFHPSGEGVARTEVDNFLSGRKNICVIRPQYQSQCSKNVMFDWLYLQLGKPYDYGFSYDGEQAMYCAKLVGKAMQAAGLPIGTKHFLQSALYLPDFFMQTTEMKVVYSKCEKKRRRLLYCLPFIPIIPALLTSSATIWVLAATIFLLLIVTGWLQHLKVI